MSKPRIIFFDLETMPDLKQAMKVFPGLSSYPGLTLKASINSIICCGYKVLGERSIHCLNAWDYAKLWKKDINNDSAIVKDIYELLKGADCVVTHNGSRFDWKFLQTRIMMHGLGPLPPIKHVDTCKLAKRNLLSFNNKLDTLAQVLGTERKMDVGATNKWDLWVRVMDRDSKAMKLMEKYCKQDVVALEKVFEKLRPFATGLPNYNLFSSDGEPVCPHCGSGNIKHDGYRYTKTGNYRRIKCKDCHSYSQVPLKDGAIPRALA